MDFKTVSYLNADGELSSECKVHISNEILIRAYEVMALTRFIDERMLTLQRQGVITFSLSSRGEEACAVASAAALETGDWMYPQYREAGTMFWRGATPLEFIHQMFGDAEDPIHGRQMPNHFGDRRFNIVTVSSPIGTKIPHAAGCAYAMKLLKEPNIAICYFGEGATSEGDFHCGLTFAAVRKAPVIFFCRNNCYAISTPCSAQFVTDGVAPEGPGHGVATYRIDGNDFFAIYDTVRKARQHCIEGKGPVLIEAMTYRMGAHSTSDDPTRYRDESQLKEWESKCPMKRLRKYMEKQKLWDSEKETKLEERIQKEVADAINIAKDTPKPPLNTLIEDVYFDVPNKLKEQLSDLEKKLPEGHNG